MAEHTSTNINSQLLTVKKPPFSVFRSSLSAKGEDFYEHHHTAFEITMVISGKGIYATNSTEFEFSDGDIFFFSTDEYHWIKMLECNTEFINIHFEPRFIWSDNFGISETELIKIFLNRKTKPNNKLTDHNGSLDTIRTLIYKTEKELEEKKKEYYTMIKIHLVNILVEMIRSYSGKLSESDISYTSETLKYMESALRYIDENLDTELRLETISDVAHMSKTYFSYQFKKLNGISPWDYITIKRIERAITYIESTNLTRLEIALRCGFNNTSNFYYAFKRVTGKTPGDYKKHSADILSENSEELLFNT